MAENEEERQRLLSDLLRSVKSCQIRYGGKSELARDTEPAVVDLCNALEAVLQHGLITKSRNPIKDILMSTPGVASAHFWSYVKTRLSRHELERYMMLKNVKTDAGRGRSWLRSALNEHSLERFENLKVLLMLYKRA